MLEKLPVMALAGAGILAGAFVVIQQTLNSALRLELGSPLWAALASYLTGSLTLIVVLFVLREPFLAFSTLAKTSLSSWTGGMFGAVYIVGSILLLPRLGAMTAIALLIAGQMVTSMLFDHFGLFGLEPRPIDAYRAAGVGLLMAGVFLIRS